MDNKKPNKKKAEDIETRPETNDKEELKRIAEGIERVIAILEKLSKTINGGF